MAADARLRSSALLALTKLMAVDAGFCEANLRLAFTLLHNKCATELRASTCKCAQIQHPMLETEVKAKTEPYMLFALWLQG